MGVRVDNTCSRLTLFISDHMWTTVVVPFVRGNIV